MMKKVLNLIVCVLSIVLATSGCKDENPAPVPIAPILKEVSMPVEDNALPGTTVKINGKGFASEDILHFASKSGGSDFDPGIVTVNDQEITFLMPEDAGGNYEVSVERASLITKLPGTLKVPYLLVIKNIVLPDSPVALNSEIEIEGEGFETADIISFAPSGQPAGTTFPVPAIITASGIRVTVPSECFGVVTMTAIRGTGETQRKGSLGRITIPVVVGANIGGGVVYYVTNEGANGYICTNALDGNYNFGPYKGAGTTKPGLGEGKINTSNYVSFITVYRQTNTWATKTAPEYCDEFTKNAGGITYNDWFLPSKEELAELFKARSAVAAAGLSLPSNNYWSSSEWESDINWAAWYVNFYETVNLVTDGANKEGWTIGIIPVRSF